MSFTPREIGTLIVVIVKANHLTNKRHIGKQDPYCSVEFEGRKGRTKTIKRGGQHPEWDEELRFAVFEDVEDELARTADRTPSPPAKNGSSPLRKSTTKFKAKKVIKLAVYADDAREPELVGEALVDLTTVLTKGEQDECYTLMYKERFAGQVYLELTFYSNEAPPAKKTKPKPKDKNYAGPGEFVGESSAPNGQGAPPGRIVSMSVLPNHHRRQSDSISSVSSMRPSSSLAQLDLYNPPYERQRRLTSTSSVVNDFGNLALSDSKRRESFPPVASVSGPGIYGPRGPFPQHSSSLPPEPAYGYEPSISDSVSTYSSIPPSTLPPQPGLPYPAHAPYQQPYEVTPTPSFSKPMMRPRYSVPTSSSGFMPLSSHSRVLPSHPSEPSGFAPPLAHTPVSTLYTGNHFPPQQSYTPMPPQTPALMPLPTSSSSSSILDGPLPYPGTTQYSYPYAPAPPTPLAQPYMPHLLPQTPHPPLQQSYTGYPMTPAPSQEPIPASSSLSTSQGPGSRPLPQPQQPPQVLPPPPPVNQPQYSAYSPSQASSVMFPPTNGYQPVPPPPPPPLQNNSPPRSPRSYMEAPQPVGPPPPLPPPVSQYEPHAPRRRASLPTPPGQGQQQQQPQRGALPIPPPPPPPGDYHQNSHPLPIPPPPPSNFGPPAQPYVPGPPPRPPQLDAEGHWVPPSMPVQQSYPPQGWA
ncbi:hypothetical protein EV421DRAFT_1897174 [Armillaria borealis]|uniref:C2 domain-containing protein n=1 Tax=Armillaria borealis TaxID=47425 RepID=A0AA39K498_9AGAR|nr:hypothetical protein EV421DRAFT_1897174 [Armillaria borealis]